jgi:hypothetical protein
LTGADLLVLAPWLFFGAGLAAIGYGLLSSRREPRRREPRRRASGRRALSRHALWRRGNRRLLARRAGRGRPLNPPWAQTAPAWQAGQAP